MSPTLCFILQSHTHQLHQQFSKSQLDQQIKIIATSQTSKHSCNYCKSLEDSLYTTYSILYFKNLNYFYLIKARWKGQQAKVTPKLRSFHTEIN